MSLQMMHVQLNKLQTRAMPPKPRLPQFKSLSAAALDLVYFCDRECLVRVPENAI